MWKVLIADDEPKIRQGLRNTLETFELPIQICGEARNGVEALEKARETLPDILLVDICMPKLSGIEFLQELQKVSMDCRVIIISGFNEFSYAQQAISLGVSCYLLKPIHEEELREEVEKIISNLEKERKDQEIHDFMKGQINRNSGYFRDIFFNNWVEGNLTDSERKMQMEMLGIGFRSDMTLILLSVRKDPEENGMGSGMEGCKEAMERALSSYFEKDSRQYVFLNPYQNLVGMAEGYCRDGAELRRILEKEMNMASGGRFCIQVRSCAQREIMETYAQLLTAARKILECRPIVAQAREYIYEHYRERELDLTEVAENIGCNPSYLSRVMKQDLGISFKDYLTMLRIKQAISLMRDGGLSLNQIAEKVGYSNQHYFSAAFKNGQGVSPSEYRRNLMQN